MENASIFAACLHKWNCKAMKAVTRCFYSRNSSFIARKKRRAYVNDLAVSVLHVAAFWLPFFLYNACFVPDFENRCMFGWMYVFYMYIRGFLRYLWTDYDDHVLCHCLENNAEIRICLASKIKSEVGFSYFTDFKNKKVLCRAGCVWKLTLQIIVQQKKYHSCS